MNESSWGAAAAGVGARNDATELSANDGGSCSMRDGSSTREASSSGAAPAASVPDDTDGEDDVRTA